MASHFSSHDEALRFVESFLSVPDSLTTTDLHKFFTPDASLKFGNNPEIYGLDALTQVFEQQFAGVDFVKHNINFIDLAPTKIHQSCNITYILKGDPEQKKITLPAFGTIFLPEPAQGKRGKGAIVERFQVWIDVAPLTARGAELAALAAAM